MPTKNWVTHRFRQDGGDQSDGDSDPQYEEVTGTNGLPVQLAGVSVGLPADTGSLYNGSVPLVPKYAVISGASSGDNTVVAAVAGKKIRVLQYTVVTVTAVTVRFESGASGVALTGVMSFGATGGTASPYVPLGLFETTEGMLLNLELGGAVQTSGHLTYVLV